MPRDNLGSAVHRSLTKSLLVGFEDTNETVQCRRSRRSKSFSSIAFEPMDGRNSHGAGLMPFMGKEEEKVMAYRDDSELQLLHVSRGALNLNQMIGSWPEVPNLGGQSKHFAEDLLTNVLDLQESLTMLSKLQNASKPMARMNNKQKQEFLYQRGQELEQELSFEALGSKRFEGGGYHKVKGGNLYRQNLLSLSSADEKTSSSKSLRYSQSKGCYDQHNGQRVDTVGSIRASDRPKKPKAPNLIAKLMGLEEVPSQTAQPVKKEEKGKSINSPRQSPDMEMPKARKLHFVQQIPDPKRETLEEINETMQVKGFLKSSQVEDHRFHPCFFDAPELQQYARDFYRNDDVPPIVITKPLHLPSLVRGQIQRELALEKTAAKEEIKSNNLGQEGKVSGQKNMVTKTSERKKVKPMGKTKEKSSPDDMVAKTPERKEVKPMGKAKEKASPNVLSIPSSSQKQHKKPNKEQKHLILKEKKQKEKDVKATKVSASPSKTSAAPAKHDERLTAARNNASTKISTSQNQNLKCLASLEAQKSSGSTKQKKTTGAKPVRRSDKAVNDDRKCKEDDKEVNSHNKTNSVSTSSSTCSSKLTEQADQDAKPCNRDDTVKPQQVLCEVIGKTNQDGKISDIEEEATQLTKKKATIGEAAAVEDDLKLLLLSSQSFLNCAQELFAIDVSIPSHYQSKGTDEVGKRDCNFFLDIAEELMWHKSHQQKHLIHSSVQSHLWGRTVHHSLYQLMEEISNEITHLSTHSIVDDDATTVDGSYERLKRDLQCKDSMINAMWNIGWVDWIYMEETDQVAGEVGEHILAWLIEEAAIELI